MLRVAVTLPAKPGEVGEYLADVTALEAAGAFAVWVEDTAVDPWVMLGAWAAITHRVGLGCLITSPEKWPAAQLGIAAATLQGLSRGRVVVGAPDHMLDDQIGSLRAAGIRIFGRDAYADGVIVTVESADELSAAHGAETETWAAIPAPPDRDAWNTALGAYEAAGATGVIVPWNTRLIDLLRNPEPDDRSDLLMSTG